MRPPMLLQRSFLHMWQCITPRLLLSNAKQSALWKFWHSMQRIT